MFKYSLTGLPTKDATSTTIVELLVGLVGSPVYP